MTFTPTNRAKATEIVGRYPRPKSAILPLAHLAQDQDGWLTGDAMKEIAELVGVTPAEVLGTCSFYTMLKREPVGRLVVSVCTNVSCLVTGGPDVLAHLDARYADDDDVYVEEVECLAACGGAPALQVNYEFHENVTPESAEGVVEQYKAGELEPRTVSGTAATEGSSPASERPPAGYPGPQRASEEDGPETRLITKRLHARPDDSWTIEAALATGAYDGLRTALTMTPAAIGQEQVKASGLRGRGGAGFPAATKWSFLPEGSHPRYLVVNDDEGEPSTFKDRMLTERDPHQLIEGIVIAAFAIEAHLAFIYVRGEFALGYERLEQAVKDAYAQGFLGENILGSGFDLAVVIHRGAGAYICGEETALLESLEGERGMPRIRPPFPAIEGLYAKPTVVNNVETLSTLPHIIAMGGDKYAELGVGKSTGTRIFSLSGHVNRPGNYEVELGTTFRELIEAPDLGGGVPNGRSVKFLIPGGASSQWLTGEHLDVPLDMDVVQQEYGVMLGSGAVMVFDDTTNPALVAWRLAKFFAHESCGKCTPCREGTGWIEKVLYRISHGLGRPEDLDLLVDVGDGISPGVVNAPFTQTTICPLGPSAVSAIASLDKYFRDEVIAMCRAGTTAGVPA